MSASDTFGAPQEPTGKMSVAYDHLRYCAINGLLRPGRRLAANELAAFYRISATPIRDAMMQLALEGFIEREAGHGYAVKSYSVADQEDRLRICHIALAASLDDGAIAPSNLLTDLALLASESHDDEARAAERVAGGFESVFLSLTSSGRNRLMRALTRTMVDQTHFVRLLSLKDADGRREGVSSLVTFASALAKNDGDAAKAAFREHLHGLIERLPELVSEANRRAAAARFP